MKKICSLIVAMLLVICGLCSPAIALTGNQIANVNLMHDSMGVTKESCSHDKGSIKLIETSAAASVEPAAAADLNEALNVPGGNLTFESYEGEGLFFSWLVEGDYAKAGNSGIDGGAQYGVTQSTVSTVVNFNEGQGISFRYKVSCESTENTDWFAVFIDNSPIMAWYGEMGWDTYTIPVPAGEHEISWCYNKDAQNSEGEDIAYLDDIELVDAALYELEHSAELDAALNLDGGAIEFMTIAEVENGYFPWEAVNGYAKSTNEGVDSNPTSISMMCTTINANGGDVLRFSYRVSSEERADKLCVYVDDERILRESGEVDWTVFNYDLTAGTHEIRWEYDKDYSKSQFEDAAFIDNVYVGTPEPVSGVEIQPTASVPGYRTVQLEWNVLPDTAYNRNVTFSSSDESIATVDENGIVTGITQGQAIITVTTEEGGYQANCTVTVTEDVPPVDIYGFMRFRMENDIGYYSDVCQWCTFKDNNPKEVTYYGGMPENEEYIVPCATCVDGIIYGYDAEGRFFKMDFEALQWSGEFVIEYFDCNVTGVDNFYPTEMAYDYTTGKMYIINQLNALWEIDMETGDVDLDSCRMINGQIPGFGSSDHLANAFAIDLEGNAYIMLAALSELWGGNGCSRLARLNLETGEFTVIGQTTAHCYQEQSMCFDLETGILYWSQFATVYDEPMDLYIVDTETAELEHMGKITEFGADILGMFIPYDTDEPNPPTPTPIITDEPETPTPIVTDEPETPTPIVTDEPVTDEPVTDEPIVTDAPIEPTPVPTDAPNPPTTGAIAFVGIGIAAIAAGSAVMIVRKKGED